MEFALRKQIYARESLSVVDVTPIVAEIRILCKFVMFSLVIRTTGLTEMQPFWLHFAINI